MAVGITALQALKIKLSQLRVVFSILDLALYFILEI